MYTYTTRPAETFCTKSSPEIHEVIVDFCKKHGIPIYEKTKRRVYDNTLPYLAWSGETMAGIYSDIYPELPLSDFLAKFRTVEPEQSERDRKLNEVAELLQQGIKKLKEIQ